MSDQLPPEVINDILLRLDPPDLLRFRCVSKHWLAVIDSPSFIKRHVDRSSDTDTHKTLFLQKNHDVLCSFDLDALGPHDLTFHELDKPRSDPGTFVVGSCHGLLCLCGHVNDTLTVLNPATRKEKTFSGYVPTHHHTEVRFARDGCKVKWGGYGFGYDPVGDDYKVVRIAHVKDPNARTALLTGGEFTYEESDLFVCSVRKQVKSCITIPYVVRTAMQRMGVLVGGALHWTAVGISLASPLVILAFDLATDEYREVPHPKYKGTGMNRSIGVLGGCLCVFDISRDVCVDVWVMKEYGVKKSWTKVSSFPYGLLPCQSIKPLGCSKVGGEVLMCLDDKRLVWYDMEEGQVYHVGINETRKEYFEPIVCLRSLVSPSGSSVGRAGKVKQQQQLGDRKQQREQERTTEKDLDFLSKGFKLKL
ncbi:hypothetical protein Tsubulata_024710 [Turnera subulata]|uniref:F-box domain-containing protein n=1 Tax=Turnera subulata TaxID=218843 RepID=A0A9Q0GAG2_9ROSI|nr:hypothetical protein Tsubulata_024710 [Turnera subulata]